MPSQHPAAQWDVDAVCAWLASVEDVDSSLAEAFRAEAINGKALIELTAAELKDDLGVKTLGQRKAILRGVAALSEPEPEPQGDDNFAAEEGAPDGHGEAMRSRVLTVEETPTTLSPITGWQSKALVPLMDATKNLPVPDVQVHAKVALEFAETYKSFHPTEKRSIDQLGAVHLYTQGWAVASDSLYAVLNRTLETEDRSLLVIWFFYIKLLVTALGMEPCFVGLLWRGVNKCLAEQYPVGLKFRWWRFSSCTLDGIRNFQ